MIFNQYLICSCDSVDKLRNKLPSLEKEIQEPVKFKEFYQFTFNYAKDPGQKGLDLDMALAYWNIVLKGKFRFLDIWTKFLKVNNYCTLWFSFIYIYPIVFPLIFCIKSRLFALKRQNEKFICSKKGLFYEVTLMEIQSGFCAINKRKYNRRSIDGTEPVCI